MDVKELKELYDEYYSNKKKLRDMLRDKDIMIPHIKKEFLELKDRNAHVKEVLIKYNLIK